MTKHTGDEHCPRCYGERTARAGDRLPEIACNPAGSTPLARGGLIPARTYRIVGERTDLPETFIPLTRSR